jgi:AAA domain, putative AbiEii toxin, Type IV TA system
VTSFLEEQAEHDDSPPFCQPLSVVEAQRAALMSTVTDRAHWAGDLSVSLAQPRVTLFAALDETAAIVSELEKQAADQATALKEKRAGLAELEAAAGLARSWSAIETRVANAKEADRLATLKSGFSSLLRRLTELSKTASDELMNQNFGTLFAEECELLRAPALKVQFLGRGGKPQRRKVISADHRVSLVLSEGEQKVLAMADFLAEARLAGTTAPVLFDDPVSSLDHRRLKEVAERVVSLAETNQVIVFTHDIFFTTTLLALSEKSKRCAYFQVTDEGGKGKVTKGTHPAWDTLKHIRAEINTTIEDAQKQEGETRAALVRSGYSRIRAWCEVFVETELLQGVSGRYQPNIRMGSLTNLKFEKLAEIAAAVNAVFEDACRFTEAHSQPLPTQGTAPTVERLEEDWARLKACKKLHDES